METNGTTHRPPEMPVNGRSNGTHHNTDPRQFVKQAQNAPEQERKLKPIPHNADIERAVLGAMLIDNEIIPEVLTTITKTAFYSTKNRMVFDAIRDTWENEDTADQVTVTFHLEAAGKLDAVEPFYIAELASETATAAYWTHHAEILMRYEKRRKYHNLGQQLLTPNIDLETLETLTFDALEEITATSNTQPLRPERLLDADQAKKVTRPWLIPEWLPANTVTIFSGQGGTGKSRLMLQIVGKITTGWTGHAWEKKSDQLTRDDGQPVVIATYEDDNAEISNRATAVQSDLGWMPYDELQDRVQLFDMRGRGPIWGVNEGEHMAKRARMLPAGFQVLKQAKAQDAALLILDPSAAAFGGNENDRASVREFMSFLNGWAYENQCAVLIIAHPPKNTGAPYSGSTDWQAAARCMWTLKKLNDDDHEEDLYKLEVIKSNYALPPQPVTLARTQHGTWIQTDHAQADREEVADDQIRKEIKQQMNGVPVLMTHLKKNVNGRDSRIIQAVEQMVNDGEIEAVKIGKRTAYQKPKKS